MSFSSPQYPGLRPAILFSLLTACTGTGGSGSETSNKAIVRYSCERGGPLEVEYTGGESAIVYRDGTTVKLLQAPVASGFHYTNGKLGIRGKGNDVMLEIGRMAPIPCHAEDT